MKRAAFFSILLTAHLLLSPLPTLAGERAGAFTVSPFVGGYSFDGIEHNDTAPVYGLRAGYDITKNWATEVVFDYLSTKNTSTAQGINVFSYRLDILYNFMPEHALVPYLAIGGGGSYKEPKNDPEFNDMTFNIGGGLKFFITDSIALRGDVRQLFVFGGEETVYNWEYSVGLNFVFGGAKPVSPKAQPEPVAESVAKPKQIAEPAAEPVTKVAPAPVPKAPLEPGPATESTSYETNRLDLNVLFYIETATILDESRDEIGKVAAIMQKSPTAKIVFEGHDANLKNSEYNIVLSQRRVESVVNYLVEKFGIERSRLSIKGYGETRPAASVGTPVGVANKRSVNVLFDCVITK